KGSETSLAADDATLLSSSEPSTVESSAVGQFRCILVERRMLSPFVDDPEAAVQRAIPANNGLLRLLLGYLDVAVDDEATVGADYARVIASHVRDLIALMLEPDIDRGRIGNGLRAAQIAHIKRYVA